MHIGAHRFHGDISCPDNFGVCYDGKARRRLESGVCQVTFPQPTRLLYTNISSVYFHHGYYYLSYGYFSIYMLVNEPC